MNGSWAQVLNGLSILTILVEWILCSRAVLKCFWIFTLSTEWILCSGTGMSLDLYSISWIDLVVVRYWNISRSLLCQLNGSCSDQVLTRLSIFTLSNERILWSGTEISLDLYSVSWMNLVAIRYFINHPPDNTVIVDRAVKIIYLSSEISSLPYQMNGFWTKVTCILFLSTAFFVRVGGRSQMHGQFRVLSVHLKPLFRKLH